jgi:serine protease Do
MELVLKPSLSLLASLLAAAAFGQSPAGPPEKAPAVSLRELSFSLERLSTQVRHSVVQIFSTGYTTSGSEESESTNTSTLLSKQRSTGTGVILSADGYIVTNSHVVRGARRIQVRIPMTEPEGSGRRSVSMPESRLMDAKLVGMDRESDLAVIRIDRKGLPFLELGDSDLLNQGELVMAFGNPLGLEGSVSLGIISSTARQIKADDAMIYIQTDAPINPGNSGGPLVNADGLVVGINTFILSQSGGSEGLGFAIPSNLVRGVYNQIRQEGHVHRGQLGLYAQTITPVIAAGIELSQDWGVVVGDVDPDGPAEAAGVKVGDIITRLNGKRMQNARQLQVNVYRFPKGEKVTLEVSREGSKLEIQVPVTERVDDPQRFADMVTPENNLVLRLGILGIGIDKSLSALLPDLRKPYGVVVAAGTVADFANGTGLEPGDVIYSVNNVPVSSVTALKRKLDEYKFGDVVAMQIERSGRLMFVAVELQ